MSLLCGPARDGLGVNQSNLCVAPHDALRELCETSVAAAEAACAAGRGAAAAEEGAEAAAAPARTEEGSAAAARADSVPLSIEWVLDLVGCTVVADPGDASCSLSRTCGIARRTTSPRASAWSSRSCDASALFRAV
eukprot:3879072-Prymnesium_polylepis.1